MGMTMGDGPPPVHLMAERIIDLRAEVERLQAILGELYVQRGEDVSTLRDAIRRAFRDSTQEASANGLR